MTTKKQKKNTAKNTTKKQKKKTTKKMTKKQKKKTTNQKTKKTTKKHKHAKQTKKQKQMKPTKKQKQMKQKKKKKTTKKQTKKKQKKTTKKQKQKLKLKLKLKKKKKHQKQKQKKKQKQNQQKKQKQKQKQKQKAEAAEEAAAEAAEAAADEAKPAEAAADEAKPPEAAEAANAAKAAAKAKSEAEAVAEAEEAAAAAEAEADKEAGAEEAGAAEEGEGEAGEGEAGEGEAGIAEEEEAGAEAEAEEEKEKQIVVEHHPKTSCYCLRAGEFYSLSRRYDHERLFLALVKQTDAAPVSCPPEVQQIVDQYADLMQEPSGLPNQPTKHHIELLPGAVPPKGRIYRMSPAEFEELRKQTLTNKGWIWPSTSEFRAPVLFVPKGNGEFRMCIDYQGLNKITEKRTEPIPRIDDLLDMVKGCTVFSKSGYHQIEMAEEDVYKTAFKTRYGTYEYLVIPFGLCNAPGTFQTEMHRIFRPYLDKFMVVYLDDILVFSRTAREHVEHLALVLQSLRDSQYKINREKSSFGVPSVIYLGHVISGDGLTLEVAKIDAIQEWPQPQTVRDVRSFMGLASYYRKFVRNFSAVAAPLTNLTKKDTPFLWSLPCQLAFTLLKKAFTRAPVLKLSDATLPFILTTDASRYGIGAVLQHDDGNGLHHVEFMSKKMKTHKFPNSTYEKELYALVCALKHWKHFLLGRHFKIFYVPRYSG
ncbi:hypothetical protein CBR_g23426 [Chara braunii]|uniref:Reverse transcriptase domain-containing protein n=1 Tax=Chara braunii TaxID=69332 RepID=A0A388L468_CHABU|nr:hypothetical protein CBR_g23426 [Chara braunii]|eukprot:GBG77101.1 hypothetical protein CBR_g23426 [Chara braunii]